MNQRHGHRQPRTKHRQFSRQQCMNGGVLIAQINVDRLATGDAGRNQHALEHAVRIRFEHDPVLERTRFPFVEIDHHQPRSRLRAHDAPLSRGGESGAAETAQPRHIERLEHLFGKRWVVVATRQGHVATAGHIGVVAYRVGCFGRGPACRNRRFDRCLRRRRDRIPTKHRCRRCVAPADAGHTLNAYRFRRQGRQRIDQTVRAGHRTAQRITHPHRQHRRRRTLRDLEVVVEAGHLEHLDGRQAHPRRQGHQIIRLQAAQRILDTVQILDQQIATQLCRAEQCIHPTHRIRHQRVPLGKTCTSARYLGGSLGHRNGIGWGRDQ